MRKAMKKRHEAATIYSCIPSIMVAVRKKDSGAGTG